MNGDMSQAGLCSFHYCAISASPLAASVQKNSGNSRQLAIKTSRVMVDYRPATSPCKRFLEGMSAKAKPQLVSWRYPPGNFKIAARNHFYYK